MKINNLGYLIKEGFRGIFLHGFMSFAAICVTIACLLIVGSFSILAYNLDVMVQALNQDIKFNRKPEMREYAADVAAVTREVHFEPSPLTLAEVLPRTGAPFAWLLAWFAGAVALMRFAAWRLGGRA